MFTNKNGFKIKRMKVVHNNSDSPKKEDVVEKVKSMFSRNSLVRSTFTFTNGEGGGIMIRSTEKNPARIPSELILRIHWFANNYNYKVYVGQEYIGKEMIGNFYINLSK